MKMDDQISFFKFDNLKNYGILNQNPIQSEIIKKSHTFCPLKQKKKAQSAHIIPFPKNDERMINIKFFMQQSQFIFNLIEDLQKIFYNQVLQTNQCLFIGYVLNYVSFVCLNPLKELKAKTYFRLVTQISQIVQERINAMKACKQKIDLSQLQQYQFYKNNWSSITDLMEAKYGSYGEIKLIFRKILTKIYKELMSRIKNKSMELNRVGRICVKIIYIICLHLMDLQSEIHLKYFYKWYNKETQETIEIKHIQNYISNCDIKILFEDVDYLLKLFF